jgi:hypothetical protein
MSKQYATHSSTPYDLVFERENEPRMLRIEPALPMLSRLPMLNAERALRRLRQLVVARGSDVGSPFW